MTSRTGSRTCCGSSRRRSSGRWSAATASSTRARTPSRRRRSRQGCSGPKTVSPTTLGRGSSRSPPDASSTSGGARARDGVGRRPPPRWRWSLLRISCPTVTTRSRSCSSAAIPRCRSRRSSRSRCGPWAGSRPGRSPRRSSCPRPRWRSGSAARSNASGRRERASTSRRSRSAPSDCVSSCTCSTSSSTRGTRRPRDPASCGRISRRRRSASRGCSIGSCPPTARWRASSP